MKNIHIIYSVIYILFVLMFVISIIALVKTVQYRQNHISINSEVIGYFVTTNGCFFGSYTGGLKVKYAFQNRTCISYILIDDICGQEVNETIKAVSNFHRLHSIFRGDQKLEGDCEFHISQGEIFPRVLLLIVTSFAVVLATIVFVVVLIKNRLRLKDHNEFQRKVMERELEEHTLEVINI